MYAVTATPLKVPPRADYFTIGRPIVLQPHIPASWCTLQHLQYFAAGVPGDEAELLSLKAGHTPESMRILVRFREPVYQELVEFEVTYALERN